MDVMQAPTSTVVPTTQTVKATFLTFMSIFYLICGGSFVLLSYESGSKVRGRALSPHSEQTPLMLPVKS